MTLERWAIFYFFGSYRLTGDIYGDVHKRFRDGENISTGELLKVDFETLTATTKNNIYKLGEHAGGTRAQAKKENRDV